MYRRVTAATVALTLLAAATADARPPVLCGPGHVVIDGEVIAAPMRPPQGERLPRCSSLPAGSL